jgi:hypothetical protein
MGRGSFVLSPKQHQLLLQINFKNVLLRRIPESYVFIYLLLRFKLERFEQRAPGTTRSSPGKAMEDFSQEVCLVEKLE